MSWTRTCLGVAAACLAAAGCGGPAPVGGEQGLAAAHPDPAVAFAVDRERTVELYDLPSGVLVMETGVAGRSQPVLPAHRELLDAKRFVDLFVALRPDLEVPAALRTLESKAQSARPTKSATRTQSRALPPEQGGSASFAHADNACNNGCCDQNWLNSNLCGNFGGYHYNWFLFDYGWSYENDGSTDFYNAAVCAGTGTSTFNVSIGDGSGGTWSVPGATYRTYYWLAGCYFLDCPDYQWVHTSVNSQAHQALHSYCGAFD